MGKEVQKTLNTVEREMHQKGWRVFTTLLTTDVLLTPPPTRQQTPVSPNRRLSSLTPVRQPSSGQKWKDMPRWAVAAVQFAITMPLYLLGFWLTIELIKANGDFVIATIDYLAFQP
jgi:hypothetical protein